MAHGYNKLALGHHLDDILETLLMNMIGKGQLATMAPRMQYKNYPLTVIRPLCYADVDSIIDPPAHVRIRTTLAERMHGANWTY